LIFLTKHLEKGAFLFAYMNYFFILCNKTTPAAEERQTYQDVDYRRVRESLHRTLYKITKKSTIPNKSITFLAVNAVYCRKCINCKINLEIKNIIPIFVVPKQKRYGTRDKQRD